MGAPVFSTEKRRGWISFSCRALRFVPSTQSPELDAARIRLQARRGGGISMLDTTSSLAVMLCGWEIDCSAFPQRNSWFGRPRVTILKKNETAPGDPEAAGSISGRPKPPDYISRSALSPIDPRRFAYTNNNLR